MNSITSTYKKTNNNIKKQIKNSREKVLMEKQVIKQMETNEEGNFITIKDHKEIFDNHPTVRLINTAENYLGRICKLILNKTNEKISHKFELNR